MSILVRRFVWLGVGLGVAVGASAFAGCASDPVGVSNPDASTTDSPVQGPVAIQVLAFNDFHGNLEPPTGGSGLVVAPIADPIADSGGADVGITYNLEAGTATVPTGGAAYLAARIKLLRALNPNTIVVSAGDVTGASPLVSNIFNDEPSVLVMNSLGLDYEGVGNHDFDRGLTELMRLAKGGPSVVDGGTFAGAKYKYLAANVNNAAQQTIFPAYDIKEFGGVKVGIIGMTLEGTPGVTVASAIQGLTFQNEVKTANGLIKEIQDKGVSAIVVVLHQGDFQDATGTYDSCTGLSGDLAPILFGSDAGAPALSNAVDVLVSAHTHQAYDCMIDRPGADKLLVTSAASFGRVVTKIDLVIDPAKNKVIQKTAKNVAVTRDITPDPDVAAIVADYKTRSAPLANRIIGYIAGDLIGNAKTIASASCETPLGDVIADAQLTATSGSGAVAAFMNPGGIRADILAPTDKSVTYGQAFSVQPFSNLLVTMDVLGSDLVTMLSQQFGGAAPKVLQISSSVSYTYSYDKVAKTGAVSKVTIGGQPIVPSQVYRITVNNFLAGGGDSFAVLKTGQNRVTGSIDLDALVSYLGKGTVTTPLPVPALNRITGNGCP